MEAKKLAILRILQILEEHNAAYRCLTVLPDGRIVSGVDSSLRVWDPSNGRWLFTLKHSGHVICVAVLPDGRIVSGSWDRSLRVWDPSDGRCLLILKGHTDSVECVAVLPNGHIVSGSKDDSLRVWDPDTGICKIIIETTEIDVSQMDLSQAILTDDLAKLLWQNGAKIPDTITHKHLQY